MTGVTEGLLTWKATSEGRLPSSMATWVDKTTKRDAAEVFMRQPLARGTSGPTDKAKHGGEAEKLLPPKLRNEQNEHGIDFQPP